MKKHEWRESVPGEPDTRFRASHFAGGWTLQTKVSEDEEWKVLDPPPLEVLRSLREKLFNKYQRRRVSWETVASVERLIESYSESGSEA